jgi:hypothetical protein
MNKSFFSEIISSVSDVKFSHDGRFIMSRDYLTIKVGGGKGGKGRRAFNFFFTPTCVPPP